MSEHNPDVEASEINAEQAYVDKVYVQLENSADNARALAHEGYARGGLGHEGGLVERDAMVFQAAKRIAQLDAAHEGLVFGRLDLRHEVDEEPRYIGRIGLRDENRDTLLIDWRAPAAAVFYQATPAQPHDVVRRRVLRANGRTVSALEDELLDAEAPEAANLPIIGEGALMANLTRARDRRMHSIVATIQADQDSAIRAPVKGVTMISGGPGVGKTVVALHRAAYLLYSDRRKYESGGVLIVGPSGVFMRYIERVLPSLGETAVALRSLGEVVDGVSASRRDDPAVAVVKGSSRMAEVIRRLARQQAPEAPHEFRIFYRDDVLLLDSHRLSELRRQLMSQGRRNAVIGRVTRTLVDALWRQVRSDRGRERGKEAFEDDLRDDERFMEFVATWWQPLSAQDVFDWMANPEMLSRVAEGNLTHDEQHLLLKSWGQRDRNGHVDLSVDDIALLDEIRYAIGDLPEADEDHEVDRELGVSVHELTTAADREFASGPAWRPPTYRIDDDPYAHVLIDEAQDLTPMQWRMVGRRGVTATWTIVGDPAQSSWPRYDEAVRARDEALGNKPVHRFHLATNYRNSSEIYAFAAAYAQRVGLGADLPTAIRETGIEPRVVSAGSGDGDLEASIVAEVDSLAAEVGGTIGIVGSLSRQAELRAILGSRLDEERFVVLTGLDTKGLEFDAIVVVRPDEIENESPTGRATLYVVYTRATQRLTVVE